MLVDTSFDPKLIEFLSKFGISLNSNKKLNVSFISKTLNLNNNLSIVVKSTEMQFPISTDVEIVRYFVSHPEILKLHAVLETKPEIKFSLCAWFIGSTDISEKLTAAIFDSRSKLSISESQLSDYAYICNYIRKYVPNALDSIKDQIFSFYNYRIDSELKPHFISLLTNFVVEIREDWLEVLHINWRDSGRDLALASLQTLLKSNPPAEFFEDLDRFERIDNLNVLTNVLLASPPPHYSGIFNIFRDKLCVASEEVKVKRIKNIKLTVGSANNNSTWAEQWTRVIKTFKSWPNPSDSIHQIDLLSKLTLSAFNSDKSTFKTFYTLFMDADEDVLIIFLSDLIPEVLNQCPWLHSCLPRPLMQLFAQLLKTSEAPLEILLSLCKLFMDGILGTSSRKCFVNYLAAHANDELIGEKCLGLIESFVERFPESRYVCLALIKSLLEGVDTWEPRLLVPFYSSFSLMARASDSVMNDLILLLKKQIYSSDMVYKRIGARGVGVFLATNGLADRIKAREQALLPDPDDSFSDIASCSQKPRDSTPVKCDYHLKIIISLLEETIKSLRTDSQSMLIFLKYVNEYFDELDSELKNWIGDWTRSAFQSSFITQIDEDSKIYKYEQDEDNPLALNVLESDLKDCAPVLLSLMGKYEKYQNGGSLEGIDALQGCAIQFDNQISLSTDFHLKFIALNYFRTILNTFPDDSRLETVINIQQELKETLKMKPAYLGEFKLFPEGCALLKLNNEAGENNLIEDVKEGSFLDELLKETRKSENRLSRTSTSLERNSLCDLNESNLQRSLVPLKIDLITSDLKGPEQFIYKEIECLIEFHYKNDVEVQRKLLDCLLKLCGDELSVSVMEIIFKCKKESISSAQKMILLRLSKNILKNQNDSVLIQNVCKLIIDVLKCPDQISDPMNLIKTSLSSSTSSGTLKHLLTLPEIEVISLLDDFKNVKLPLKNRIVLLKSFGLQLSKKLKSASLEQNQKILASWAELIQIIRSENNYKLLQGIVKESHVVLESFLNCDALKLIEGDTMLLEGSEDREAALLLLKTVQQSTRGLQIICNHLKYSKGGPKTSTDPLAIPNLKKSLESVIFRVKEILTRSGCLGAFWMGNLKHRDLDGQEISSQVELLNLRSSDEDETDHEEELSEITKNNKELSEEFIYNSDEEELLNSNEELLNSDEL